MDTDKLLRELHEARYATNRAIGIVMDRWDWNNPDEHAKLMLERLTDARDKLWDMIQDWRGARG